MKYSRVFLSLLIVVLSACSSSTGPAPESTFSVQLQSELNLSWSTQQVLLDVSVQNVDTSQSLSYQWSVLTDNSDQVSIATPLAEDTLVSFSTPDIYLLQVTARNGSEVANASIQINVALSGPPYVNAGEDVSIVLPNSQYQLTPSIVDDNTASDLLSYQWQTLPAANPAVSFSDSTIANPVVSFADIGLYELEISASDGEFSSSDTLIVNVLQAGAAGLVRPSNTECIAPAEALVEENVITLQASFPNLPNLGPIVALRQAPGDSSQWFATSQDGLVVQFENTSMANAVTPFIDISADVLFQSEQGLLGMDFHPDYANNGQLFLYYTAATPYGRSMIVRAVLINNTWTFETVLAIDQPANNHNGGNILFGPDGYLYIGMGDGGGGSQTAKRGLLGAMLRIDVDAAKPYAIPPGNPFAGNALCNNPDITNNPADCPEIYAWGLRNPWRWSFDRDSIATNPLIWLGDVGQNSREEINLIEINKDYGWNTMEGSICTNGTSSCDQTGLSLPVHDYSHTSSGNAVVGGYIYRGNTNPDMAFLRGSYIFADTYTGQVWGLSSTEAGYVSTQLINSGSTLYSFAEDLQGELYLLAPFNGVGNNILHITASNSSVSGKVAKILSKSGCVDPLDPSMFSSHTIPYDINTPLWSDNADKSRFFAIPDGSSINVSPQGDFIFPIGSVLGKHFILQNKIVETRLFMFHQSGPAGYSYEWQYDADGKAIDAFLLSDSKTVNFAQQEWYFPSQAECFRCHQNSSGYALGLDTRQLNRNFLYPQSGIIDNQLTSLNAIALFSTPLTDSYFANSMASINDTSVDMQTRVKSYLHSNCSHCHRPNGGTPSNMDLRLETPLANMVICDQPPQLGNLGLANPLIIDPNGTFDLPNSILTLRMEATPPSGNRMPPLATSLVDEQAVTLIKNWINGLTACP